MPIQRRITLPPQRKTAAEMLERWGDILLAGKAAHTVNQYFTEFDKNMAARLQSIAAKAEKLHSWDFMDGCFKQATELYVVASILYERFPEHVILSDGAFDALAKFLLKNFDKLPDDFKSWYNLTSIDLKAGTGHAVVERPDITGILKAIVGDAYRGKPATQILRNPIVGRDASAGQKRGRASQAGSGTRNGDGHQGAKAAGPDKLPARKTRLAGSADSRHLQEIALGTYPPTFW